MRTFEKIDGFVSKGEFEEMPKIASKRKPLYNKGIPESKRSDFQPTSCLSSPALTSWSDAEAQVIISASANHSYSLKRALDWPTRHINEGFTNEEAVEYLHFFLETPEGGARGADTIQKASEVYESVRLEIFTLARGLLSSVIFCIYPSAKQVAMEAITCMKENI